MLLQIPRCSSNSIAAQGGTTELQFKPGTCPPVLNPDNIECPTAENLVTECLLDKDCNSTRKCCTDGCSMKCLAAQAIPTPVTIRGAKGPKGDKGEPVSH